MAAALITDYAAVFSNTWPVVARRLRKRLLRRGVPESVVDDVVQETAVAVLARQVPFETAEDLLAWATTVGRRLAIAEYRRCARVEAASEIPSRPVPPVEDEVIARLAAEQVLRAIPELSLADRTALAPTQTESRAEAVRDNVRRHRARARLRVIAGAVWGAVVAAVARARDAGDTTAVALAGATAITLSALLLPFSDHDPVEDRALESREAEPPKVATAAADGAVQRHPSAVARHEPSARSEPSASAARRPENRDDDPRELPAGAIALATPNDDQAQVRGRGDAPPEIALCTSTGPRTRQCIAIPVPPTPLDDL